MTGTTTVFKGQELTDLQRALEQGAISPADYQKVRARILRRDNKKLAPAGNHPELRRQMPPGAMKCATGG